VKTWLLCYNDSCGWSAVNMWLLAGDGQVTIGNTVMKHKARKVRRLHDDKVVAGFAGTAAGRLCAFWKVWKASLRSTMETCREQRWSWWRSGASIVPWDDLKLFWLSQISLAYLSFQETETVRSYGIMTRSGLHCAPSAHKTLGTFPRGTVRFSLSPFYHFKRNRIFNRLYK